MKRRRSGATAAAAPLRVHDEKCYVCLEPRDPEPMKTLLCPTCTLAVHTSCLPELQRVVRDEEIITPKCGYGHDLLGEDVDFTVRLSRTSGHWVWPGCLGLFNIVATALAAILVAVVCMLLPVKYYVWPTVGLIVPMGLPRDRVQSILWWEAMILVAWLYVAPQFLVHAIGVLFHRADVTPLVVLLVAVSGDYILARRYSWVTPITALASRWVVAGGFTLFGLLTAGLVRGVLNTALCLGLGCAVACVVQDVARAPGRTIATLIIH